MRVDEALITETWAGEATASATRALQIAAHLGMACEPLGGVALAGVPAWAHALHIGAGRLLWPREQRLDQAPRLLALETPTDAIPLAVPVLGDGPLRDLMQGLPGEWTPVLALRDQAGGGAPVAHVWRSDAGEVVLPFDPDAVLLGYWSERYLELVAGSGRGPVARTALQGYYAVRGLLPRPLQIWLRRRYARVQGRRTFPRWPVEPALHDFLELFLRMLADVSGATLPHLAPWPDGHRWALVLTHDVETAAGLDAIEPLTALERAHGLRSSWNFVPERYTVDQALIDRLWEDGFEVGLHGLRHDGRDLSSLSGLRRRLPAMQAAARRWRAVGFRSPALHRQFDWMPLLGLDYDSSYPDCDPFEPQAGGCLSWWPYFNRELVELPLTLAQDHTLFVILGHRDESAWVHKAQLLRERGGMALVLTHPDYVRAPGALAAYEQLLERYADDPSAWRALPAEVAAWWRRRAASRIVSDGQGWAVVGPAAGEAHVELVAAERWW